MFPSLFSSFENAKWLLKSGKKEEKERKALTTTIIKQYQIVLCTCECSIGKSKSYIVE